MPVEEVVVLDSASETAVRKKLMQVRWLAWADLVLLVVLLAASFAHEREWVRVLGAVHGVSFVALLVVAGIGAVDKQWGWWFPAIILVTTGPPGALLGEWRILRRLRQGQSALSWR